MLTCKITKLAETVWPLIIANIPVMIYGPTGVGKSTVIKNELMPKINEHFGPSVLHDTRLSTKDIVDGTGMPVINHEERATYWTRPAFIPKDDGKMHVMFYDEFGHATPQLQHMAYALVLDRALGEYPLPKNNRVLLASNTREDGGGDNKMLKPLQNRMAHVTVEIDTRGFLELTKRWGWDTRLIAFLTFKPELIHPFVKGKTLPADAAFPTPRSLEFLSNAIKAISINTPDKEMLGIVENVAQAICGNTVSRDFANFCRDLAAKLPRIADILSDPKSARIPPDHHYQQVVASGIAQYADKKNAATFAKYLSRKEFSPEIAAMAAHDAIKRNKELETVSEFKSLTAE